MVGPFRPKPGAGPIARPDPAPLRLRAWGIQALLPPDSSRVRLPSPLAIRLTTARSSLGSETA